MEPLVSLIILFLVLVLVAFPIWALIKILSLSRKNEELEQRFGQLQWEFRTLRDEKRAAPPPAAPVPAPIPFTPPSVTSPVAASTASLPPAITPAASAPPPPAMPPPLDPVPIAVAASASPPPL